MSASSSLSASPSAIPANQDLHTFSDDHLRAQLESAPLHLGYKIVRFYVDAAGVISKVPTDHTAVFYLSPSGGTLRDSEMNIVMYSARYDLYKNIAKGSV
jgi:hypothetical protein